MSVWRNWSFSELFSFQQPQVVAPDFPEHSAKEVHKGRYVVPCQPSGIRQVRRYAARPPAGFFSFSHPVLSVSRSKMNHKPFCGSLYWFYEPQSGLVPWWPLREVGPRLLITRLPLPGYAGATTRCSFSTPPGQL